MFWFRTDEHIANALVASCVLRGMSHSAALYGPHMVEVRAKMRKNAAKFEQLAIGVVNECYEADTNVTAKVLKRPIALFRNDNSLKLAYSADSLEFLSQRAAIDQIDKVRGGKLEQTRKI